MRRVALVSLAFVIAVVAGTALSWNGSSRYEKLTEAQIQAELLKEVPSGSPSEVVRSFLRRKTGKDPLYQRDFYTVEGRPILRDGKVTNLRYYAGAVHATLASYGPVFSLVSTKVQTRWEFDARDRLIDVRVTKQPFGP